MSERTRIDVLKINLVLFCLVVLDQSPSDCPDNCRSRMQDEGEGKERGPGRIGGRPRENALTVRSSLPVHEATGTVGHTPLASSIYRRCRCKRTKQRHLHNLVCVELLELPG